MTYSRSGVLRCFPRQDEFSNEASDHFGFDLELFEFFSIVYADRLSNELGDDGEVPAVCPDDLSGLCCNDVVKAQLLFVVETTEVCSP